MCYIGDTTLCPQRPHHTFHHDQPVVAQFGGSCYEILQTAESWTSAEKQCHDAGGHLASINNEEEQNYVLAFVARHHQNEPVWIGLNDYDREGYLEWTTG